MEIKKTVLEDTTILKELIERSFEPIDENLKSIADVSFSVNFKNVTKVGWVQILTKNNVNDFDFYVILTKDNAEGFYIWDDGLYTFERYNREPIADKLLDIIYSDNFLLEPSDEAIIEHWAKKINEYAINNSNPYDI